MTLRDSWQTRTHDGSEKATNQVLFGYIGQQISLSAEDPATKDNHLVGREGSRLHTALSFQIIKKQHAILCRQAWQLTH